MARKSSHLRHSQKNQAPATEHRPSPPSSAETSVSDRLRTAARGWRTGLFLLLLAGLLLRVLHLSDLSLWMDEYVHVMRAKNFLEGDGPLFTDDNNGILLTICLLPGFAAFGPEVFWARFPSVVFGVALIGLVYHAGARWFNRYVGLLAASGATFSLFLVFWSRVCRNYSPVAFFYLLLGLVFWMALEEGFSRKTDQETSAKGISRRYMWGLPVAGGLALLSHQLSFFFVFTVAVYALLRLGATFLHPGKHPERGKYGWMSALTAPLLLVVFVPPLGEVLKKALSPFLLSEITEWAIPNWERLAALSSSNLLESFQVYDSLLQYDLRWFYLPSLAGLLLGAWRYPRQGVWVLCSFAVPFLLLSFVFREPVLRRYVIFVYPYLFIGAGLFFYLLWEYLEKKWLSRTPAVAKYAFLALPFGLLLFNTRWKEIGDLALARQLEGHIVDMRIASWSFTNWKEACEYVDKHRRPGDVLMATVPTAVSYYLRHENVLWFRQAYFDTREKRYKLNAPKPNGGPSAASFEDLVRTVQQAPRGWLLADYYLENIFTDERALLWVYQNMHFYPQASADGSVMVFGWDHSKPAPQRQNLVVELGHDDDKTESKEYHLTLPESLFAHDQVELTVRTSYIDSNREALVLFNGENAVWLPPNAGAGIEEKTLPINRAWVRPGRNSVQVLYEPKRPSDPRKGFTLYFLSITGR